MAIERLSVRGFRNLRSSDIEFSPQRNYLFGPNGAGKTNTLEAVHYLAIGRSFRRSSDRDVRGFGMDALIVSGRDTAGNEAEVRFDGAEKRLLRSGTRVERLSDFLGWLPVVVLLLDDIELVRGAPPLRRAYMDMALAKSDREYIRLLNEYRRALLQHNRLLTQQVSTGSHLTWEQELVRTGVPVMERRRPFVQNLLRRSEQYCRTLSGIEMSFAYRPSVQGDGDLSVAFTERLAATRERSIELGHTLVGPHRDDFEIRLRDGDLRRFGSVGEQRLTAVALRLAEADALAGKQGNPPTFLLDEIASELDPRRSSRVLETVTSKGQTIYAAARSFPVDGKEFRVEGGEVKAVS